MLEKDDIIFLALHAAQTAEIGIPGRSSILGIDDRSNRCIQPSDSFDLLFEFPVGEDRLRLRDPDQRCQVRPVPLREQLLGQERHNGRDRTLQDAAEIGIDQLEAVLEDQDHHIARLDSLSFQGGGVAGGSAQQLPVGKAGVLPAGEEHKDGCLLRSGEIPLFQGLAKSGH